MGGNLIKNEIIAFGGLMLFSQNANIKAFN